MDRNRLRVMRCRAGGQVTAKPKSIKGTGGQSGTCVRKAVELTSGDLPLVPETRPRVERSIPTGRQKSAAGAVVRQRMKAQTVPRREGQTAPDWSTSEASMTHSITAKLNPWVNGQWSSVARPGERKFPGCRFTGSGPPDRRIRTTFDGCVRGEVREYWPVSHPSFRGRRGGR
jgi:hypothetical protein